MKTKKVVIVIFLLEVILLVPYLLAAVFAGEGYVFGGFLLNPIDGNSYLAKMMEGWQGSWRFVLPYTAQPGQGAYLFLFYLFLGHLARWLGAPLIWVFHAARAFGAAALLAAAAHFLKIVFKGNDRGAWRAFLLLAMGSGLGWAAALSTGTLTADFWVAEAYPFLSMYANPHFPLGLALILALVNLDLSSGVRYKRALQVLAGLLLAVIQPFGLVIATLLLSVPAGWAWFESRQRPSLSVVWCLLLGGPFLLYQFWAIQNDPVLRQWNAQNLTPAPAAWDFLLSMSPALLLAGVGVFWLWKQPDQPGRRVLITWLVGSILLVYLPFNLQRRFITGAYFPMAVLAVMGAEALMTHSAKAWRWVLPALFILSLPTNLILLLSSAAGIAAKAPLVYLAPGELRALAWVQADTSPGALLLASPEMGMYIPAYTGRRVVYGHPFETTRAEKTKLAVETFFRTGVLSDELRTYFPQDQAVYIFYGPREEELGSEPSAAIAERLYNQSGIKIYQVKR